MKIERIVARALTPGCALDRATSPRTAYKFENDSGNALGRHREFTGQGSYHDKPWPPLVCMAIAEDGTWGIGVTDFAGPVAPVINDLLGPVLTGENVMATERLWDMMTRYIAVAGGGGLEGRAISAVDLALWDLKGKLLGRPVYELIGGPVRDRIFCYATGSDTEWHLECGFQAVKITCPRAEAGGVEALDLAEAYVARTREMVGDHRELMLDCWPVTEVDFMVRLAERLRPYRLKWLEDFLMPGDMAGFDEMRRRVPWQTLATGERWYELHPFSEAVARRSVDILQPDIRWVGGLTACIKIGHVAEAAGLQIALHGAMNDAFGQHACHGIMANTWGEFLIDSAPGVPLEEGWRPTPGMAVPKDGWLVPSDAPGFGIELTKDEIEAMTA